MIRINGVKAKVCRMLAEGDNVVERPCHLAGLGILGTDCIDRAEIKWTIDMTGDSHSPPRVPCASLPRKLDIDCK